MNAEKHQDYIQDQIGQGYDVDSKKDLLSAVRAFVLGLVLSTSVTCEYEC